MAISIYLGNVSKRKNSTFVPSLTQGAVQVVLKDGTSDTAPTFLLTSSNKIEANYLRWEDRYYFIDDITIERNNLYSIKCSLDVLATYKSYIRATTAFVAYDTTENTELTDSRISMNTTKVVTANSQSFSKIGSGTCVVMSIVGQGCTSSFAVPEGIAQVIMNNVEQWLNNTSVLPFPDTGQITDIVDTFKVLIENLVRIGRQFIATGKASDSIKSAILMPIAGNYIGGGNAQIFLGNYETNLTGKLINAAATITDDITLDIPWPAGINDWRRNYPYTQLYLYLPYVGCVSIPTSEIMGDTSMTILTTISPTSGDVIYTVTCGTRKIFQFNSNLSSQYAIGSSNISPAQAGTTMAAGVAGTIGAIATGGATALLSGTAGIIGVTNNIVGMPDSIGVNAGGAAIGLPQAATLYCVYHDTNVPPESVAAAIGTPTMAVKSLGSLSGYVECRNASVSAPAESAILDRINNYLNTGFFIE